MSVVPFFFPVNVPVGSIVPTVGSVDVNVNIVIARSCFTESASYVSMLNSESPCCVCNREVRLRLKYKEVKCLHEAMSPAVALRSAYTYPLSGWFDGVKMPVGCTVPIVASHEYCIMD